MITLKMSSKKLCKICKKECDKLMFGECLRCYEIRKFLHRPQYKNVNVPPVYDDYVLKIVYKITEEEHDGYCSDPYNESSSVKKESYNFPLLKEIEMTDDLQPTNESRKLLLKYYQKDNIGHGNGYCGLKTVHKIKKIKLRNKKGKADVRWL